MGNLISDGSSATPLPLHGRSEPATPSQQAEPDVPDAIVRKLYSVGLGLHEVAAGLGLDSDTGRRLISLAEELDGVVDDVRGITLGLAAGEPRRSGAADDRHVG